MSEAARVSVIIPTRDRTALLPGAIESALRLAGDDLAIEIVVVENGVTGAAEAVAREYGAVYRRSAPGASAARNAGMHAASGAFLAFLDDDDRFLPGHLRPHLQLLAARPEFAGVVGQAINASNDMAEHGPAWPRQLPADGDLFAAFLGYCPQVGATLVRACVRESVGGFDEGLLGDEDWDWHLRLALRRPIGFVAEPCVLFRQRPPGADTDIDWERLPYARDVFSRNLRRAGPRRPSWPRIARSYLIMNGAYASRFSAGAAARLASGDRASARRALRRAAAASPLHLAHALLRDGEARRTARRAFIG
jgi:glycosyltransferase involved in cell wall biosynthesis